MIFLQLFLYLRMTFQTKLLFGASQYPRKFRTVRVVALHALSVGKWWMYFGAWRLSKRIGMTMRAELGPRFRQQRLIRSGVGRVTVQTIFRCWQMREFRFQARIDVRVTGEAKLSASRNQLDPFLAFGGSMAAITHPLRKWRMSVREDQSLVW